MVNHFEPEPREVLSRVEVPTVEASDDRVDALLLFAAVDRRFYQQSRRGGAAITLIHEQAPQERNVQALQMEMACQRDDTRQHVRKEHAPDAGSLDVVTLKTAHDPPVPRPHPPKPPPP